MPKFTEYAEFSRGVRGSTLLKNWESSVGIANLGQCLLYHPTAETWFSFGNTGSITVSKYRSLGEWTGTGVYLTNYNPACALPNVHLSDGSTHFRIGGAGSSSTVNKIRVSSDLGTSWTSISIGSSDTKSVNSMAWDPDVGHVVSVDTDIYKSASGGSGTYSASVSTGATIGRRAITIQPANEGTTASPLVVVVNGTTTYYTATTGSFTARTHPSTIKSVEWCSLREVFIGLTTSGTIYQSATGTSSWTVVYNPGSETFSHLTMFGATFVAYTSLGNVLYSEDGTTWHRMFSTKTPVFTNFDMRAAYSPSDSMPQQLGICGDASTATNPTHFISLCG